MTLVKGLSLLRAFGGSGEVQLGNKELAEASGLSRPTVSRLVKTLTQLGYLRQSRSSGRYALGLGVLTLAYPMLSNLGIRHIARPAMKALADAVKGQVSMGMRDGHSMVFIESARSPHHKLTLPEIGATLPLLASSMGRACLGAMAELDRARLLAEVRAADAEAWARHGAAAERALAAFPRLGFACSFGEVRPEMYACAAPLLTRVDGEIVVINCGVPANAAGPAQIEAEIGPRLLEAVREVESATGLWSAPMPRPRYHLGPRNPVRPRPGRTR